MIKNRQQAAKPKSSFPEVLTILFIVSFIVALYVKIVFF